VKVKGVVVMGYILCWLVGLLSPYLFDTLRGGEEREKTILFIAAEQDRLFFALGVEEKRRSCFIDVTRLGDHLAVGRYPYRQST
jgi:hypothetical protein